MAGFSRRMQQALDAVRAMSPENQDLLAAELIEDELEAELAAARRGEFASEADVNVAVAIRRSIERLAAL